MSNHTPPLAHSRASVNLRAAPLTQQLIDNADAYRIGVSRSVEGATIIDAGIECPGSIEVGRIVAEICMGGQGTVSLQADSGPWPLRLAVHSNDPVMACLASQYAGWSLSAGEGKGSFHALGSGPGRALAKKEPLFAELGYVDAAQSTVLVLEVDRAPPAEVIAKVARDTGVAAERLTFVLTPTSSWAGTTQVVARVLEVALHKAHAVGFDLSAIVDGFGSAPLPTPGADFLTAMGRTNDAILYGGTVQLFVRSTDEAAEQLTQQLPSAGSRDYGKPFGDIFKAVKYDFYQIDGMLFAPAVAVVSNLTTGRTFRNGSINAEVLNRSFGL